MTIDWTIEGISADEVRKYMKRWSHMYDDGAEINATKLAEDTAYDLDLYNPDDQEIPECIFELAAEVADWYELTWGMID